MQKKVSFNYIEKDKTDIIKGIAIIFMLIHHFFTYPAWFVHQYEYLHGNWSDILREPFKICVCVFAFLTGYFYVYARQQNYRYSLRKITDLWINYFVVFLILYIIAVAFGCFPLTFKSFLLESFSVENQIVNLAWYVKLYLIAMLILPLYVLIARKHILIAFLSGLLLPALALRTYNALNLFPDSYITLYIRSCSWLFLFATGFIFAQYELFTKWFDPVFKHRINNKFLLFIINLTLVLIAFFGRYVMPFLPYLTRFSMDFVYAPFFVYGIVNIVGLVPHYQKLLKPLSVLGKYSLIIWFVHSVFYNVSKSYTQPLLYISANPVIVMLWGTLLCLAVAFLLDFPVKALIRLKNKWLFRNKS